MSFPTRFAKKYIQEFVNCTEEYDTEDGEENEMNAFQQKPNRNPIGQPSRGNCVKPKGKQETKKVLCWNCQNDGHIFNECPKPRRGIFCYKCGTKNVVIKDCMACKPTTAITDTAQGDSSTPQTPAQGNGTENQS